MITKTVSTQKKAITEEDLLHLSAREQWIEVVNGEAVPMSAAGFLHGIVINNVFRILDAFVLSNNLGYVFGDGIHYILLANAEGVRGSRIPDVSFVRADRIPEDFDVIRPIPVAPNLAVEVISPTDSHKEISARVDDYLSAGTNQVWVIYPEAREVYQYRQEAPKTISLYTGDDKIEVDDLFPGLELIVETFFVIPGRSG